MPFLPEQTPGPPSSGEGPSLLMRHTTLHPLHTDQDLLRSLGWSSWGKYVGNAKEGIRRVKWNRICPGLSPSPRHDKQEEATENRHQSWQGGHCQLHPVKKGSCKCKTTGFGIWGTPASPVPSSRAVLGTVPKAFWVWLDRKSVRVETLLSSRITIIMILL